MARQIFRATALKRYNERLEKVALPRYASLPWVGILWGIFGLLVVFTAVLWAARTPVYASGPAVIVAAPAELIGAEADDPNRPMVAAFLPAEYVGRIGMYQRVRLLVDGLETAASAMEDAGVMSSVAFVEPDVVSPAAVRSRFDLDASTGMLVEEPVVVVLIALDAATAELLGSIGEAQIEIGSQPGLALLPGIGGFFDTNDTNGHELEALLPTQEAIEAIPLVETEVVQPPAGEDEPLKTEQQEAITTVPQPTPADAQEPFVSFVPFVSDP